MATDDLGNRPWLLLPGTLCTAAVFDGLLDALGVDPANRHVVAVDRPNIGYYARDFKNLSDDTIICGFSLGAIVAAHYADRVNGRALVLFGLNPYPDDPDRAPSRHALAQDVALLGGGAALKSRNLAVNGTESAQTHDAILHMADQTTHLIAAQTQLALSRPGALDALQQSRLPVMSLTGSQDISAPVVQGKAAAQAARKGQFHMLNGLGHFALLEDPKACANALTDMLRHA